MGDAALVTMGIIHPITKAVGSLGTASFGNVQITEIEALAIEQENLKLLLKIPGAPLYSQSSNTFDGVSGELLKELKQTPQVLAFPEINNIIAFFDNPEYAERVTSPTVGMPDYFKFKLDPEHKTLLAYLVMRGQLEDLLLKFKLLDSPLFGHVRTALDFPSGSSFPVGIFRTHDTAIFMSADGQKSVRCICLDSSELAFRTTTPSSAALKLTTFGEISETEVSPQIEVGLLKITYGTKTFDTYARDRTGPIILGAAPHIHTANQDFHCNAILVQTEPAHQLLQLPLGQIYIEPKDPTERHLLNALKLREQAAAAKIRTLISAREQGTENTQNHTYLCNIRRQDGSTLHCSLKNQQILRIALYPPAAKPSERPTYEYRKTDTGEWKLNEGNNTAYHEIIREIEAFTKMVEDAARTIS